jgi:hypothetical protein
VDAAVAAGRASLYIFRAPQSETPVYQVG